MRISLSVAAALLVLSGCSAQGTSPGSLPALPSVSAAASAPAKNTAQPPVPPSALPETAAGAAQFVRVYLDVVTTAFDTGDATPVRRLTAPGCEGCQALIGAIEEPTKPGETVEGGAFIVKDAEAPPIEQGSVLVDLRYSVAEIRVRDNQGRVLRRTPATPVVDAQMRLVREGATWLVQGFVNL